MSAATNWSQRAAEALERTEIMVLATVDADSGTWTSPVQFQAGNDYVLSFLSGRDTRHGRNIARDSHVAVSIYSWPGPDGGNLGLQITGHASTDGPASGGWQRYTIRPTEVWCFDSCVDHHRHRVALEPDAPVATKRKDSYEKQRSQHQPQQRRRTAGYRVRRLPNTTRRDA